jgi:hypothetical protein
MNSNAISSGVANHRSGALKSSPPRCGFDGSCDGARGAVGCTIHGNSCIRIDIVDDHRSAWALELHCHPAAFVDAASRAIHVRHSNDK